MNTYAAIQFTINNPSVKVYLNIESNNYEYATGTELDKETYINFTYENGTSLIIQGEHSVGIGSDATIGTLIDVIENDFRSWGMPNLVWYVN